ncbi:hypothetical protein ACFY1L_02245 [Streptomyces sp. NPDC001663]|uniref:hypothetical protein n=1 Tax=Streptomyces sp. NPDC001663 TaxID=3364597 RepID=UPI003683DD77
MGILILSMIGGSRVASAEYTVELSRNEKVLGGGFRMTRHFVLTADHHLGDEIREHTSVDLQLPQGLRIAGTVEQRCWDADLALIRLYNDDLAGPEIYFDQARRGERWRTSRLNPYGSPLHGTVLRASVFHHREPSCSAVEILVLDCAGADDEEQQANRTAYTGRAGMPIERAGADRFPVVLGVAVRLNNNTAIAQEPDGQPQLVAATVKEALRRLRCLHITEVIESMWPEITGTDDSLDLFRVDEVQQGNGSSYREKYESEVRARLREFGFITPVTIPSALTRANDETEGQ